MQSSPEPPSFSRLPTAGRCQMRPAPGKCSDHGIENGRRRTLPCPMDRAFCVWASGAAHTGRGVTVRFSGGLSHLGVTRACRSPKLYPRNAAVQALSTHLRFRQCRNGPWGRTGHRCANLADSPDQCGSIAHQVRPAAHRIPSAAVQLTLVAWTCEQAIHLIAPQAGRLTLWYPPSFLPASPSAGGRR